MNGRVGLTVELTTVLLREHLRDRRAVVVLVLGPVAAIAAAAILAVLAGDSGGSADVRSSAAAALGRFGLTLAEPTGAAAADVRLVRMVVVAIFGVVVAVELPLFARGRRIAEAEAWIAGLPSRRLLQVGQTAFGALLSFVASAAPLALVVAAAASVTDGAEPLRAAASVAVVQLVAAAMAVGIGQVVSSRGTEELVTAVIAAACSIAVIGVLQLPAAPHDAWSAVPVLGLALAGAGGGPMLVALASTVCLLVVSLAFGSTLATRLGR